MHQPIMTPDIAVPRGGDIDDTGPPGPPAHLGAAGTRLWAEVVQQYRIGDSAGLALVTTAAECLDRLREAQEAVREHGVLIRDRYGGLKANPAIAVERGARDGMIAALRSLNLNLEPLRDRADHVAGPFRRK
jgi:phage terminase small subunit